MGDYSIRRMRAADAENAALLEAATFARPWTLKDFRYEMQENPVARYLVAEQDGRMLGFAGVHIILDEGHITNIAVAEAARGRGIGKALTKALMQYASNLGVDYLTLEVRAGNEKAIGLYKSLGFVKVGVRARYYEDNHEDAWLMVCGRLPGAQADFREPETVAGDGQGLG